MTDDLAEIDRELTEAENRVEQLRKQHEGIRIELGELRAGTIESSRGVDRFALLSTTTAVVTGALISIVAALASDRAVFLVAALTVPALTMVILLLVRLSLRSTVYPILTRLELEQHALAKGLAVHEVRIVVEPRQQSESGMTVVDLSDESFDLRPEERRGIERR